MAVNVTHAEVVQYLSQSRREWKAAAKRALFEAATPLLMVVVAGLVLYQIFWDDVAQFLGALAIDWSQVKTDWALVTSMPRVTLGLIFIGWAALSLGAVVLTAAGPFPSYARAHASIKLRHAYDSYKAHQREQDQRDVAAAELSAVDLVTQNFDKALYHAILANQAPRDKFGIAIAPSTHEITPEGILLTWGFRGDDDPIHEYLVPWATLGVPPEHQPQGAAA